MRDSIFANQKDWASFLRMPHTVACRTSEMGNPYARSEKLYARQAEVFAAYAAYNDYEIGRVVQEVQDEGLLDNTIIIYLWR